MNTSVSSTDLGLYERFWSKVNKNGPLPSAEAVHQFPEIAGTQCWEWAGGGRGNKGYGGFDVNGVTKFAHRVAWFLETGKYPQPCGLHKCDNRACVRFSHLFEGTYADNNRDRGDKGHTLKGSKNGRARLNTKQVIQIRKRAKSGESNKNIADSLGLYPSLIRTIVNRISWQHLT